MAYLTRDDILKADDLVFEDVPVPEWGGTVRLKSLSGAERDSLELSIIQSNGKTASLNLNNLRAKTVALSAVDENGKRLFTEKDVRALGEKNGTALGRCFAVAQRLSGLSDEDVQELTAGFLATAKDASGSD